MSDDPAAGRDEPFATLVAVLDEPEAGRRRLPKLVGLLDAEDETVRVGAAWAVCHVASTLPDTAEYLTRRLADRLDDDEPASDRTASGRARETSGASLPALEAELAFGFVAATYPEAVAAELEAIESEIANRPRFTAIEGNLARANYHLPEIGNRDVGRTRLPGEGGSAGPQRVYSDDGNRDEYEDPSAYRQDDGGDGGDDDGTGEGSGEGGDSSDGDRDEDGADVSDATPDDDGGWQPADQLSAIVYGSRFDQLTVLARRRPGRYGDRYRTLGVVDDEQLAVGLLRFDRPDAARDDFGAELGEYLGRWAGVDDHDNVVTLYDWGLEPEPWVATEYTERRLADRGRFGLPKALANARDLAGAVGHLHENGIVHGGVGPGNVVYYGNVLDDEERQSAMLTNVGLLHVFRRYFDPTERLDPRYAAPEYFDRRFGRVDHATDVYQLGAVCYRLLTGRHPYDGTYGRVRERVLQDPPPRPSDVVDVPERLDDVVTKAMARQKIRRYETVTHLEQELRGTDRR